MKKQINPRIEISLYFKNYGIKNIDIHKNPD